MPLKFAHFGITYMQIFSFFAIHFLTKYLWFSNLYIFAQITHCVCLSLQSPGQLWLIPKQVMYEELSPTFQYFSTTFRARPNLFLFAQSYTSFIFVSIVMTMADLFLFPDFNCSSKRSSLINYCGIVLSLISVENSISR